MREKEEIGLTIANARKKKKLTQQDLAKLLMISDKAISNWETGKNYPDISYLNDISKYLDIDIVDIMMDKKSNRKKIIKVLKIIFNISMLILFLILLLFFISNFKKNTIYSLSINDKNISIDNSTLTVSKEVVILNLNKIENITCSNCTYDIKIYFKDNNDEIEIVSKKNFDGISLVDRAPFYYFPRNIINNLNNIYLDIVYYNESEELINKTFNIEFKKISSVDKVIYHNTTNSSNNTSDRTMILLNNMGYSKTEDYKYQKNIDNLELIYDVKDNIYTYIEAKENIINKFIYYINDNIIEFKSSYNDITVEYFTFNEKIVCHIGECDNYENLLNNFYKQYNQLK